MKQQVQFSPQTRREAMKRAGLNFVALAFAAAGGLAKDKHEADQRKQAVKELPWHVEPKITA